MAGTVHVIGLGMHYKLSYVKGVFFFPFENKENCGDACVDSLIFFILLHS